MEENKARMEFSLDRIIVSWLFMFSLLTAPSISILVNTKTAEDNNLTQITEVDTEKEQKDNSKSIDFDQYANMGSTLSFKDSEIKTWHVHSGHTPVDQINDLHNPPPEHIS